MNSLSHPPWPDHPLNTETETETEKLDLIKLIDQGKCCRENTASIRAPIVRQSCANRAPPLRHLGATVAQLWRNEITLNNHKSLKTNISILASLRQSLRKCANFGASWRN